MALDRGIANCGAPRALTLEAMACGRDVFRLRTTTAKNIAMLTVCPTLNIVALIPEAAPLCSMGEEFIMAAVLGEENRPFPAPMMKTIAAKVG